MDGFNDRVGKVFDCISSSSSKGGAAWSLSDAQIQRQPWNRDKGNKSDITINNKDDDETLVSSSFHNLFKPPNKSNNNKKKKNNTFDDPDDEFEDDDDHEAGDDERIDDLDVRSSIGLDPTLDFEEEEDEYDKIAAGTENASGPLLYMKDVTHHAPFLNSHNVLQNHTFTTTTSTNNNNDNDDDQPMFNAPPQPSLDNALKLKSILKRKREDLGKPSPKRVRFDPICKHHDAPQLDAVPVPQVSNNQRSRVPDYLVNPSKYTRYTFNEDDDDDKSSNNTEAYYDFLDQIKKSKDVAGLEQKPPAADLPASVVFIPRKKRGDAPPSNSDGQVKESSAGVGIGIAAVEVQQDEVSDIMLQDEPDVDAVCAKLKFQKPTRQYRSKIEDHDTVS